MIYLTFKCIITYSTIINHNLKLNHNNVTTPNLPRIPNHELAHQALSILGNVLEQVVREVKLTLGDVAESFLLRVTTEGRTARQQDVD